MESGLRSIKDISNHKTEFRNGAFKMFRIMRRKDKSTETTSSESEPDSPRRFEETTGEYIRTWNDSPVVNPLANPPIPREERIPPNMARRLNIHVQIPPHVQMTRLSQTDALNKLASIGQSSGSRSSDATTVVEPSEEVTMEIRHRRLLEEIVNNCAREPQDRKEWGYWFKAYIDGRFNMSTPPQTPPRDPNLLWIPTPFPAMEYERIKALSQYDINIASQIEADLRTVLRNTATALGAEYSAISLVDYESETFLINHPIRIGVEPRLKRACSIGAHVMISNDTMVILDTKKDWRFQGNPSLGNGTSRISFYAGSPLISPNGHNIGVLSITSRTARPSFSKRDLRSLNNFASVVSTHLERLLPENRLSLASIEINGTIVAGQRRVPVIPDSLVELDTSEASSPNRGTASQALSLRTQQKRIKRMQARLEAERKLTEISTMANNSNIHGSGLPILPLAPEPPITPASLSPPPTMSIFAQKLAQNRIQKTNTLTFSPPVSPTSPSIPRIPSLPLNLDLAAFSTPQNLPQAKFLISDIAKQVDFDYLYIIRLEPISSKLSYTDLLSAPSFQIVMVHSYRRNTPPSGSANQSLNTDLHLKALQDRCGLTAINSRETSRTSGTMANEDFYQVSVLLPVQRDYVDETGAIVARTISCEGEERGRICRGHILGAYKKRNTGDYKQAIERLGLVANALGILMFQTAA